MISSDPPNKRRQAFAGRVIDWQRQHGRHELPWQHGRDPYRIWLSEVMLQQTQVAAVLRYYERFVARFPDVRSLAAAPVGDVLALWSGLGYYRRARDLHRCAGIIVESHDGRFPRSSAALASLPGIGRSTAAAIAAFAFGERVAILDGNVQRVLARWLGFCGDLSKPDGTRELWRHATALLPDGAGIEAYTQGLMDLGAAVCTVRAPRCPACPVAGDCAARRDAAIDRLPVRTRTLRRGHRESVWLWLRWRDRLWLEQRPPRGVWSGLWSLPEYAGFTELADATQGWPGTGEALPKLAHALTHFDWVLHPRRWTLPAQLEAPPELLEGGRWWSLGEALELGLPAPLKRLLVGTERHSPAS